MKRHLVLVSTALLALPISFFIVGAGPAGDDAGDDRAAVDVVPLVTVRADSPMEVQLALEPASDRPVRYLFRNDSQPIDRVYFQLLKDGKYVPHIVDEGQRALTARRVREMKPGERLIHTVSLREKYGPLKPGTYTLEVKASGGP